MNRVIKKILDFGKKRQRIPDLEQISTLVFQKSGIEIGGPSRVFSDRGYVPIYRYMKSLDGCNFSNETIWEGKIEHSKAYNFYRGRTGSQFLLEASDLKNIADESYDFLISSNCLEHVANPIKAFNEWVRVVKKGGMLLIILPNKDHCFDHNREVTSFDHLLEDYQNDTKEDDLTHLNEILEQHDLEMDKRAGTMEQFKERSVRNFEFRALHHHVFDIPLLSRLLKYSGVEVLFSESGREHIIIGRKTSV